MCDLSGLLCPPVRGMFRAVLPNMIRSDDRAFATIPNCQQHSGVRYSSKQQLMQHWWRNFSFPDIARAICSRLQTFVLFLCAKFTDHAQLPQNIGRLHQSNPDRASSVRFRRRWPNSPHRRPSSAQQSTMRSTTCSPRSAARFQSESRSKAIARSRCCARCAALLRLREVTLAPVGAHNSNSVLSVAPVNLRFALAGRM